MNAPRQALAPIFPALALSAACLLALAHGAPAQQPARAEAAHGVELYKQGKLDEAARAFRAAVRADENDAESWHHLGVVLNSAGKAKEARKAFEEAVKCRPDYADSHAGLAYTLLAAGRLKEAERAAQRALELAPRVQTARYTLGVVRLRQGRFGDAAAQADALIADSPDYAPAYPLKAQAHLGAYSEESADAVIKVVREKSPPTPGRDEAHATRSRHLREAARSYEKYLQLEPNAPEAGSLREQIETLRVYAARGGDAEPTAYSTSEVTTKAVILSRPYPLFTDRAREEGVKGTVIVRAVLASDGQVRHILVLRGLSHGLTESVVEATRRIQFKPATKDGRPVSVLATFVHNFNIR